jgi:hypothetical protein
MPLFRSFSLRAGPVSHVENTAPTRETRRAEKRPVTIHGDAPVATKITRTPTLTRLKNRLSLHSSTPPKKSPSAALLGETSPGSWTPSLDLFTVFSWGKHTLMLKEPEETITNAGLMRSRLGVKEEFDQWLSVRLQKSSKAEVAKELHDSAQEVIDQQFADEMRKGRGGRFKEWVKKEEARGATVFEICHCVENARTEVSKLREAAVKKAVDKGASKKKARKEFDRQIMQGRTLVEAQLYLNIRAWSENDDATVVQYLTTAQEEQIKKQEAEAQKNRPVMDHYDRALAELASDSSDSELDSETAASPSSAKRR